MSVEASAYPVELQQQVDAYLEGLRFAGEPGTARLAAEVDERGGLCDDLMVIYDAPQHFRLSHGGGTTQTQLERAAHKRNVEWRQDFDVHMLSLQGPRSTDILQPHIGIELNKLPYFAHVETQLFGRKIIVSRGGYSGEQGFEVSCASTDAVALWDNILDAGKPYGAVPASWMSAVRSPWASTPFTAFSIRYAHSSLLNV